LHWGAVLTYKFIRSAEEFFQRARASDPAKETNMLEVLGYVVAAFSFAALLYALAAAFGE
jgi:hypothetical protein